MLKFDLTFHSVSQARYVPQFQGSQVGLISTVDCISILSPQNVFFSDRYGLQCTGAVRFWAHMMVV